MHLDSERSVSFIASSDCLISMDAKLIKDEIMTRDSHFALLERLHYPINLDLRQVPFRFGFLHRVAKRHLVTGGRGHLPPQPGLRDHHGARLEWDPLVLPLPKGKLSKAQGPWASCHS